MKVSKLAQRRSCRCWACTNKAMELNPNITMITKITIITKLCYTKTYETSHNDFSG